MSKKLKESVIIFGGGLVGSLLALYLGKRGYRVDIYEKRADIRYTVIEEARSINLALSERGWNALRHLGLEDEVKDVGLPMYGRAIHNFDNSLAYQPYGLENQAIYSVTRFALNRKLVSIAATLPNVYYHFNHRCVDINVKKREATLVNSLNGEEFTATADYIFGADGAFSATRFAIQKTDRFEYKQSFIEHGYKEFHIKPLNNDWALDNDKLHIWPRGNFMMIALPNPDKSFTCTLFFPFEGDKSFSSIKNDAEIQSLFEETFADLIPLIPDYKRQFKQNPTSSLVTIHCFPWVKNNIALIGDAAHAIVPFFGQGMNCGFEDCFILDELLNECNDDLSLAINKYQFKRKPSSDAIAELALNNFVEMRDSVGDPKFLLRKKIEVAFHKAYPTEWVPMYTLVSFSTQPYELALAEGKRQDKILKKIMELPDIENFILDKKGVQELWAEYVLEKDSKL